MAFTVIPVPGHGTEDVVVATSGPDEGAAFTGTEDGSIFRISHDGRRIDRVARTGGRPMGIELEPDGRLLVCDAVRGLLHVDPRGGHVEAITDTVAGRRMVFCNNAAVEDDGTIWFSDSSTRYGLDRWMHDVVENTRTGRLMRLRPGGEPEVVLDGLAFANGVTLSRDQDFVAVAESGGRTVVRRWLTGNRAGMRDLLCQGLPAYPDNIALGSDGLVWVTLPRPAERLLGWLHRSPLTLRRVVARLPERLHPTAPRVAHVQAYDDRGRLVHDVELRAGEHGPAFQFVTGVREHDGRVWMSSLHEPAVAVYDL